MTARRFNNDQRRQIADEMFSGKSRKQVAFDWGISRTCIDEIFYEYLEWRMTWKPAKVRDDVKVTRLYFHNGEHNMYAVTEDGKEWKLSADEIKKALNIFISQPLKHGTSPRIPVKDQILGFEHETSNSKNP